MPLPPHDEVAAADVARYVEELFNWGRWGPNDQRGCLNFVGPETIVRAAGLVSSGTVVPCGRLIEFAPKPSAAEAAIPPLHFMQASGENAPAAGQGVAYDWVGLPLHGLYLTHLDAHAHLFWDGSMYNGVPATAVTTDRGARHGGVEEAANGIVGRGVLLDIPAALGLPWLEGAQAVSGADLELSEQRTGIRMEAGDVALIRTGYGRRRHDLPEETTGIPGLAPDCLPWIYDRSLAAIGTDTGTDPTPGPGGAPRHVVMASPVHVVCLVAMGMWIIDGCDLEQLAATCERLGRWEFLFVAAPLRLKNSTGSPLNPIAVF